MKIYFLFSFLLVSNSFSLYFNLEEDEERCYYDELKSQNVRKLY